MAGSSSSGINMGTSSADANQSGRSGSVAGSSGSGAGGPSAGSANTERDSFSRWRDRQYYGPRRWFQSSRDDSQWDKDNGKNFEIFCIFNEIFFGNYILSMDHFCFIGEL